MSDDLTCIRFAEIARTVNPEEVPELHMHLGSCSYCQAQWAATKQAIEAAKQIPYEAPGPEQREQIRNALMFNVSRPGQRSSRRWLQAAAYAVGILGAAGVFAAVNSIAIPWLKARGSAPVEPNKVTALVAPKPEPEVVPLPSLDEGLSRPAPAKASQAVRRAVPAHKAPTPAPAVEPPAAAPAAPEARTPSAAEQAYAEGWEAMRASRYGVAADSMKRAAEAAPSSTLAADARYWEAVALARQGQAGKARTAMESFLRRYPGSPRLGEVSVMLGWMLVESQEWTRAEQLFRAAEADRAPSVRDSARKGLEIVARVQARSKPTP